ncbi:MAG: diguanylate cyclase [Candidatus Melainabacteria bacterium]|nr:diguanylate cyclase [Candidatus Melainabacteria bacterium]
MLPPESTESISMQAHSSAARAVSAVLVFANEILAQHVGRLLPPSIQQCFYCTNGTEALGSIYQHRPHLVVSDLVLPEINGYQLCRILKSDPAMAHTPFILVSDLEEHIDRFWGFKAGTDAYIAHNNLESKLPEQAELLLTLYQQLRPSRPLMPVSDLQHAVESSAVLQTRLNQLLDRTLMESTLVGEFRRISDLAHDRSLVNHLLFSLLEGVFSYDVAALYLHENPRGPWSVAIHIPEGRSVSAETLKALQADLHAQLTHLMPAEAGSLEAWQTDIIGQLDETATDFWPQAHCFTAPLEVSSQVTGLFMLAARQPTPYADLLPMPTVLRELQLLAGLRALHAKTETLAVTDRVTQLYNYSHLMLTLDREFSRAKRYELPLSLAIIDIDDFRALNEQWGHALGDEILRLVGQHATQSFRSIDIPARFSGVQIAVLFPDTTGDSALVACERLRVRAQNHPFSWKGQSIHYSVSVGLTSLTDEIQRPSDLIKAAFAALEKAKQAGRNRTELLII